jgi:hypothetical protein
MKLIRYVQTQAAIRLDLQIAMETNLIPKHASLVKVFEGASGDVYDHD